MADQRPAFRFRLPWQSAAPPPRPTFPRRPSSQPTPTPTPITPQTAATPAPIQPTITTTPTIPATPQTVTTPAPTQPTTTTPTTPTAPQTAATQSPPQPTIPTTPTTPTAPQTAATQAPSQPTITTTPTPTTPQTAETQVPTQLSSITTPAPTPQTAERVAITQPTITTSIDPTTVPQRAETQIPAQPPAATTTPIPTAERPPFRPPGVAPAQAPLPQSQASRTESQPSSPSRVTTQPASPSRAATQSRASSQPSTPPRAVPQSRAVSFPSSPSRRSPQLPSTPRTATQPRSTTNLASRPAGQTLPSPSPSSTTAQPQPTREAVNRPTSPSKREQSLTSDSSQPSANSTEVISPLTDKQEPKSAVSETPSLELQPKPETISGIVYDSQDRAQNETSIQPNQMMRGQPSKESGTGAGKMLSTAEGQETPTITQISHSSTNNGKPELFPKEFKPEETKEVKEVVQENKGKAHDGARHKEADLTGELGQTLQTKDLPSIAFQSGQAQKHIDKKEITATSASNGKQTKITAPQARNKTMVVGTHEKLATSNGEHIPLHKEVRDDISKLVNKMAAGDSKHSIDDRPVSIITLAGENRGASMQVGSDSSTKEGAVHIHRGYKIKPDDPAEATTDGEKSFKEKSNNPKTKEDQASEAYVNSNVQCINNSIMFSSSITERNPGVHLIHSHFPTEPKKPPEKQGLAETRKAEFNMTPSQKLTYEPTVRRRCLRGLFLESSDSDTDGTKSQRHGCRVGCNEKSKGNNIDVL